MRIVLDNAILVRANSSSQGLARDLLLNIVESDHILVLSNEMLYELARVLRYPRMLALYGLSETRLYDYIGFLRETAEMVVPDPLLITPIRDIHDSFVMQTAIIGEADILCTKDQDFFEPPAEAFLRKAGITVLDDIALIHRLRSQSGRRSFSALRNRERRDVFRRGFEIGLRAYEECPKSARFFRKPIDCEHAGAAN